MKSLLSLFNNSIFGMEFPKENDANWSKTVESLNTETHIIKKEKWISKDGKSTMERFISELKSTKTLDSLKNDLKKAIESEDFEKAAEIRDEIKKLS